MLYPVSEVRNLVTGLHHPECVAVGRDGTLYTGGDGRRIYRTSSDGRKALLKVAQKGKVSTLTDSASNLYVTTYASSCIDRVAPDRKVDLLCQDVENLLLCQANICAFGGEIFDQLYVGNLGRDHISVLDLKVKGQPLWCHRSKE